MFSTTINPANVTRLVRWMLCVAVGLTLVGHGIKTFRGDGTSLNAFLFLDLGWSHQQAMQVEQVALSLILGLALIGMLRPYWWFLAPAGFYLLLEAVLNVHVGGTPFYELAPAAAALRYGTALLTPLVLAGYLYRDTVADNGGNPSPLQTRCFHSGALLLRIATAVVFLTHGYEAWQHHPRFIDLIIGTGFRQFDFWIEESTVTRILTVIGVVDILVGIALLLVWNRFLLAWAACWGLLTALSRMTAFGWGGYPDVLLRATHFLVPFALMLLIRKSNPAEPSADAV